MLKNYTIILCLFGSMLNAQNLTPGFDVEEYLEMLKISVRSVKDSAYESTYEAPENFHLIYQSDDVGLDNSWDFWRDEHKRAVISIRGTTVKPVSWLENIYAAMVPAQGVLQLSEDGAPFPYHLADHPNASIHVGWLIGMAFMADDIVQKMNDAMLDGVRDFYIMGHSQGGSIAYMLTAYLRYMQKHGNLPSDIHLKTYCSAAPKPGNLYFAYDYEALTQGGWACNIINAADWVPEVPMSIQTLDDFNHTNPFKHADAMIKEQKLSERLVLRHVFNKLDKPTRKAQKNYQKFLGDATEKMIAKQIKGLQTPEFVSTNNYVRTGNTIVLTPNDDYRTTFPEDDKKIFNHHIHEPYIFLAKLMN